MPGTDTFFTAGDHHEALRGAFDNDDLQPAVGGMGKAAWGRAYCGSDPGPVVAPGGDPCDPRGELPAQATGAACRGSEAGVGGLGKEKECGVAVWMGNHGSPNPSSRGNSPRSAQQRLELPCQNESNPVTKNPAQVVHFDSNISGAL